MQIAEDALLVKCFQCTLVTWRKCGVTLQPELSVTTSSGHTIQSASVLYFILYFNYYSVLYILYFIPIFNICTICDFVLDSLFLILLV